MAANAVGMAARSATAVVLENILLLLLRELKFDVIDDNDGCELIFALFARFVILSKGTVFEVGLTKCGLQGRASFV